MISVPTNPLQESRIDTEELLATAIHATTDFRVRLAERPGVAIRHPALSAAIRYATSRGFSVRELSQWLGENGIEVSPTHVFRLADGATQSEYFIEAFQRLEDAARWVLGMCKPKVESTSTFVNAILGTSWQRDSAPISSDSLMAADPANIRAAAKDAVGTFLDAVKDDKCPLFASDIKHLDVLKHIANEASDTEIASLLLVAQQIHQRPPASVGVRKLRERTS